MIKPDFSKEDQYSLDKRKRLFIKYLENTNQVGIKDLLNYLEQETDFFIAPASSNYHGNYYGGLLDHSLLVFHNILKLNDILEIPFSYKELVIVALLHDVCKANFYEDSIRNKKVNGRWIQEPYFSINDELPLGHGEKSIIILQDYIKLTKNELFAIRWHMMSYDDITKGYAGNLSLTNALTKYPIIALLHSADLFSISLKLKGVKNENIS